KRDQVKPVAKACGVQLARKPLLDNLLCLVDAVEPDQGEGEIRTRQGVVGVQPQRRAISLRRLLVVPGYHKRVPMEVVAVWVLRVGLREQQSRFDSLVDFAGYVSEKSRGDRDPLSLAHPVTQLVSPRQILVAECEIAKIAVRSSELLVGQGEFTVPLDGPLERRGRLSVLPLLPKLHSNSVVLESLERSSRRLFDRRIELADRCE